MFLIRKSRIFELLMQYSCGICLWVRNIHSKNVFWFLTLSSHPSWDASALEIPKRNKACIWKTAGIEAHLLLQKDLCQANKKDANLLWWTVTPPSKCYYGCSQALKNSHSQNIHHRMAIWQPGVFNVIHL